jgi:hypothetical protein
MYEVEVVAESYESFRIPEDEADSEEEAKEIAQKKAKKTTRRGSDKFRLADHVRVSGVMRL